MSTPIDTQTRPHPPNLDFRPPDCSVCGEETRSDGPDGFNCEYCQIGWDSDGEIGEWDEPDAERCAETTQPWRDNTWIKEDDDRKHKEFRCVLEAGHGDDELGRPHANPEMGSVYVKGWR